ncbi:MAG: 2Fe-2S ferredoxin [Maricaulis sp.]|jgi:phenylpropionate dioxygenase-like ring-hydroxylating dioxygenase large terminal subunit|nr:2Fe-2S ferredoxin [Maricaulis sp.]HAQ36046.1 2Fe-2S ferredoxin [Alphaproteobacteria bacterium]
MAPDTANTPNAAPRLSDEAVHDDGFLRDLWYFGALASEVKPGETLHREMLGEPILFGRTHDGSPFAMRDICPHRGILLSGGRMVQKDGESTVECPYHGWRFRKDGGCAAIPSLTADQAEAMDLSRIRVRSYPVHEAYGLIWIYIGADPDAPPAIEPPVLDLPEGARVKMVERETFNCHVDHAVIGLMDPAHIPFIHRQWWWRTEKSVYEKEKVFGPVERGFSMLPHRPSSNSFAYKALGAKPETEIRFQIPGLRTEYVKVGNSFFTGFTAVTPTNANSTAITIVVYWKHPVFDILPNFVLRKAITTFIRQDRDAVNAQQKGLAYKPKLMLIHDADVQAKWYYKLKQAWRKHRQTGEAFANPVKNATLRWRS